MSSSVLSGGPDPEPGLLPDPGAGSCRQHREEGGDQRNGRLQKPHPSQVVPTSR